MTTVRDLIEGLLWMPLDEEVTLRCAWPEANTVHVTAYASTPDGADRGHVDLGALQLPDGYRADIDPIETRREIAANIADWLQSGHGAAVTGNGILATRIRQHFGVAR